MPRFARPIAAVLCAAGAIWASRAPADPPPATQPSLLGQLSEETRRLYAKARSGMVRVQLPTPDWLERINEQKRFMAKWGSSMDPAVRERVMQEQRRALAGQRLAQSRPADAVDATTTQPSPEDDPLVLLAVGVRVDSAGHVVLPLFVEPKSVTGPTRAFTGDGRTTTATLVASDAKTNLSVFKLADPAGDPMSMGTVKPEDGNLVMVVSADTGARLVVWTPLHAEHGVVLQPDGAMSGFAFDDGHFLSAPTFMPVVKQMIDLGRVRRAFLGVAVREITKDDPMRRGYAALGSLPAIQIIRITDDSAAQRCGLREGDLILEVAEQAVGDAPTFAAVIAAKDGQTKLAVLRKDDRIELSVDLRPKE